MVGLQEMFLIDAIKVVDCFFVVVVELRYLGWYGNILELNDRLVEVLEETHVVPKFVEWFGEERVIDGTKLEGGTTLFLFVPVELICATKLLLQGDVLGGRHSIT